MTSRTLVKLAMTWLAARSVHQVVSNFVKVTTPVGLTPKEEMMTRVGSYLISGVIGEGAMRFVARQVDCIFALSSRVKIIVEEGETNGESERKQSTEQ